MILAIDTATRWTGLALHDGATVVAEHGWRSVNTQTVEMAPAIAQMLKRAEMATSDLKAIAVALGPGSYTGLRVGLGVAKGIALGVQIPLVGIPTLDIVAAAVGQMPGQLVAVAEAGRRRITANCYSWQNKRGWRAEQLPSNTTWEELLEQLEPPAAFTGEISPQARRHIRHEAKGFQILRPAARVRRAAYLAELGWERLRKGEADDPAELVPLYLREP